MAFVTAQGVFVGQKVDALHADQDWHRATVLAVRGGPANRTVRVHYDGIGDEFDENVRVSAQRVRERISTAELDHGSNSGARLRRLCTPPEQHEPTLPRYAIELAACFTP